MKECLHLAIILDLFLSLEQLALVYLEILGTGFLLLATHILACITVGIILGIFDRVKTKNYTKLLNPPKVHFETSNCTFSNLGEVLGTSIYNAITTVMIIGGFVVLFSVVISILEQSHIIQVLCTIINPILKSFNINTSLSEAFITGIIELTNGVKLASIIHDKIISNQIILCAFLLGFGGFSILLQVFSITSKSDLSIKPYLIGKFLQGIFAAIYTYTALHYITFLNLDLEPVFSPESNLSKIAAPDISPIFFIACFILLCSFIYIYKSKKQKNTYSH